VQRYRVVIIGAGIVGASIARVLSMYENLDVTLVEKEPDVGWGVSKANTSIIHPGHEEDPEKHPLRARLCVEGNRLWREWVKELDIPAKWPGELMVFTSSDEEKEARKYVELAKRNNVPGVRIVYRDELKALEPNINPNALGAVYAPTAGTVSPMEAVVAIAENAVENGVKLLTETEVTGIRVSGGRVMGVETNRGFIEADIVINAAGLYADKISHRAGVELGFFIRPRKGQYLLFDEDVDVKPLRILHTTPTPITKGVYAITTVHGNLMIGPTAEDLPIEAREDTSTTFEGLEYLWREAGKLLRALPPRSKVIRTFAGLRPEPPDGNWLIKVYTDPWGFVNVAGIRSPGLTAAPAIAHYVAEQISKVLDVNLVRKEKWNPFRRDITRLRGKSLEEIDKMIRQNPDYGEIVCYCRMVSKAEVLEAIERIRRIGAKVTLEGIKFRTLAMMGMCQGAFCRWRVAKIVSEALGVPMESVVVKRGGYGIGDIKLLLRQRTASRGGVQ
jgi:glycerol-3-phosphate dehydrogenase